MGIINSLYTKLALLSPRIEVKLRQLYWANSNRFGKYNPNVSKNEHSLQPSQVNFSDIINQLKEWGVAEGSLLIVHSSYDHLKSTGMSPNAIIDELLKLVGNTGTLAMPVIRIYKDCPSLEERLKYNLKIPKCKYNIRRTPVSTGLLPAMMMRYPNACISKFPLNPLCAIGPLAEPMMAHNIDGDCPSPHGVNSCWKFCLDHSAYVCSIGTDLRHHNTMGHVAEEAYSNWHWSEEEWYDYRSFTIELPNGEIIEKNVKERKPKWGMLHLAELNRYQDFLKNGIVKSNKIDNILVEFEESQKLISYLMSKNKNGYPYFE